MLDMVLRCLTFSQTKFLISLHTSSLEHCYYIKNLKNPNNDSKILQNSHLKKNNKISQLKMIYFQINFNKNHLKKAHFSEHS